MSDELEQKRQEKIADFKLQFDFDEPDEQYGQDIRSESDDNVVELKSSGDDDGVVILDDDNFSGGDISSYSDDAPDPTAQLNKKELRAAKRHDKKRRRIKAKKNRVIFRTVWVMMLIFVSIMIGRYIMVGINDMLAVGRDDEGTVEVHIPANADLDEVTQILIDNNIINSEQFFKLYATVTKSAKDFTEGTFQIPLNNDYLAIINALHSQENRTDTVKIQFREGISILEMAALLEENKVCSSEDFLEMCNSDEFDKEYEFLKDIKNKSSRYYKLEGYLFPDTYEFYVNENPDSVVYKFLHNYNTKMYYTKIRFIQGEKKQTVAQRAADIGMSLEDVITLASLIQAEAANEDDMYMVSSILHNRLNTKDNDGVNEFGESGFLKLQLDSTVFYPYKTQDKVPATMRKNYVSRYSTYKIDGLPAGPICNPGIAAIEAAVNPPETDYYYFCHKSATNEEAAVAYYARTNDEHLINQHEEGLI